MDRSTYKHHTAWIIGASSGIGKALAEELSQRGARLILSARSEDKLQALNESLGGQHYVYAFDIASKGETAKIAEAVFLNLKQVDRVIVLSALYEPMKTNQLDLETTKNIIDVNLFGTFNLVHALLPRLEKQSGAQLALCGSVAGYMGLPNGQPYSATKAAIINLAETLAAESPKHVDIKLINPGFVKTQLTDKNDFDMPMIITPEQAAKSIADGLKKRRFEVHFPGRFTYMLKLIASLPYLLLIPLLKRL